MKEFKVENIKNNLFRNSSIEFTYIFGSAKDGLIRKEGSDIDIAVYINKKADLNLLTDIIGACQEAAGHDKIDIAVLNNASSILAFEAISGNLIFSRDEDKRAAFFSLTCRMYEDEMMRLEKFTA
jgi:predicted nucleotidyltransferase